jgi:hypothetical protein
MNRWILLLLPAFLASCASNPQGLSKVRAAKGSPASVSYLTVGEMEKMLRSKGGDDVEVEAKMLPKGGRIFYASSRTVVSYSEQENTNPYLSVVENDKEIKFCDESDFESKNVRSGATSRAWNGGLNPEADAVAVPLKSNKVEMECDLPRPPSGDFEVRLLDSQKRIVETYFIKPAKPE